MTKMIAINDNLSERIHKYREKYANDVGTPASYGYVIKKAMIKAGMWEDKPLTKKQRKASKSRK